MTQKWKRALGLALAAALSLSALAGCSSSNTGSGGDASPSGAPNTTAPAGDAAPAKDTLVVALATEPNSVTTFDHDSLAGVYMNLLTYNGLVRIDNATLDPVLDLAESYEVADDDVTWTFKLKQGVKFHNGDELTADDVAATIQYVKAVPKSVNYTSSMKEITAVDPYTVQIVTDGPYAGLLYDLGYHYNFIMPKKLLDEGHDFNADPVGTGPYKLVKWDHGNSLTFEAFGDYFDEARKASIPNLRFDIIPEGASRTMALESGSVDFVYEVSTSDIERLKSDPKFALAEVPSVENYFLALNVDVEPFNDVNVRMAINYALNREDIVAAAMNGYATPSYSALPTGFKEFTDENAAAYDPAKAKEYLAAWGGDPASITVPIICSNESKIAMATVIQGNLAEVGINTEIVPMDTATYFEKWGSGDWTSLISSWSPSNALTYIRRYHSDYRKSNPGSLNDPEVDKMVNEAIQILDADARAEAIKKIVARVNTLAPQPYLFMPTIFRAYDANLKNVVASATGYVAFNEMSW